MSLSVLIRKFTDESLFVYHCLCSSINLEMKVCSSIAMSVLIRKFTDESLFFYGCVLIHEFTDEILFLYHTAGVAKNSGHSVHSIRLKCLLTCVLLLYVYIYIYIFLNNPEED